MKTEILLCFFVVILATETVAKPPDEYKTCSDDVGDYVLNVFTKQCGQWKNNNDLDTFLTCVKNNGMDTEHARIHCAEELGINDLYGALCPVHPDEVDIKTQKANKFRSYTSSCCLINHALQFSEDNWTEGKEVMERCYTGKR